MNAKIFIGNLDFKARNENLIALCRQYGTIKSVVLVTDPETGNSKGFGFVEFESSRSAQNALALNGRRYMKRSLNVEMAEPEHSQVSPSKKV